MLSDLYIFLLARLKMLTVNGDGVFKEQQMSGIGLVRNMLSDLWIILLERLKMLTVYGDGICKEQQMGGIGLGIYYLG